MLALGKIFQTLRVSSKTVCALPSVSQQRLFASNDSTQSTDEDPIILAEDLPPIPPNYGYVGDVNVEAIHEINKIRKSFQYG
jgi:hypothetical protein